MTMTDMVKFVYFFGGGKADGDESMKNLLGGKGANLAEMAGHKDLQLPVPPGFTITTEVCTQYFENKKTFPKSLRDEVHQALSKVEKLMGKKFGDPKNPLLVSVRSGARRSMPGMMETVLNVGLTEKTIPGMIERTNGNERFVYDAYRRLIMMYSDVVMEKAAGIDPSTTLRVNGERSRTIEPANDEAGIRKRLEKIMTGMKKEKGVKNDTDLDEKDLKKLCLLFKQEVKKVLKKDFPDDPYEQLWGGIAAVFSSWNGRRAVSYRRIENIPQSWGTAVNVQSMVFGNMGQDSATGVGFTRNPGNGNNHFYGEYLTNAQGEDVVAGIRTPSPVNEWSKSEHNRNLISMEKGMPALYKELFNIQKRLEKHYRDMQDIEFTVEKGRLFMLQCRIGKRNGPAAVKMAVDMVKEKLITPKEAVMRVTPGQLDELLHPIIDPKEEMAIIPIAKGLPAGPGGAGGEIVFSAAAAVKWAKEGKQVILVREETNPEDVEGMRAAQAILTARGGMTSHAALVARGWGKCCVVGCGALHIDYLDKKMVVGDKTYHEGDWLTLNGSKGAIYEGKLAMVEVSQENKNLNEFLKLCDRFRKLKIRTNADTPDDSKRARAFGAEGIGLFRIEHMFYGKGSDKALFLLRKMIVSKSEEERQKALNELFPYMKADIKGTLSVMRGLPVTIRLMDPPLHEFVPRERKQQEELCKDLKISLSDFQKRANALHESNPMMGHRGVRLGITYPEITRMQVRAIFEATAQLLKEKIKVLPEIMIPVLGEVKEYSHQNEIIKEVYREVLQKYSLKKIPHLVGTMIEIPRACITAGKIAGEAEFFSFGTNDLTQMGFGFSRDDIGSFLPEYLSKGILPEDPFATIDEEGIGELISMAIIRGRKVRKDLKIGICGEHGGDPQSIHFCHKNGMNYVSCSPFRVPIARLAAAQAVLGK